MHNYTRTLNVRTQHVRRMRSSIVSMIMTIRSRVQIHACDTKLSSKQAIALIFQVISVLSCAKNAFVTAYLLESSLARFKNVVCCFQTISCLQSVKLASLYFWGDSFTDVGYNISQAGTLLGCINRYHCVFWTPWFIVIGNLIRTCYSETWRDYLIIKLVIVYRWYENLPLEWNKIIPLPFFFIN